MYKLHQFISSLNLSLKSGNLFFKIKKTKFTLQIVCLLIKYHYFTGYKLCSNNSHIIIFLKLTPGCQRPLLVNCTLIANSNCSNYLKWSQLQHKDLNSNLLILTTSKGLMTQKEAYYNRVGGQVLIKII